MVVETRVNNAAYERLALLEPDRKWELRDGYLREKPGMTASHNWLGVKLGYMLLSQLDWADHQVRIDSARVHRPAATYFIPDVFVLPTAAVEPFLARQDLLEVYPRPLPLVVEIWSPSTGNYDVGEKLAAYKQRSDIEIWFIHPYERTLTSWRRLASGAYEETIYRAGQVRPVALPGVCIDLEDLFNR